MTEKKPKKLIEATNLGASRGYRTLFRNVSFSVMEGDILELRGSNGSGKSTLLRIIAGLTRIDQGILQFGNGAEHKDAALHFLGHQDSVKAQESVARQMEFWADFYGEARDGIRPALEQVGLWKRRDVPGRGLSAGQRRRLSLARLVLSHRPIWLLDEPFAALDTDGQAFVKAIAAIHIAKGGAIIAAMHGDGFAHANTLSIRAPQKAKADSAEDLL